MCLSLESALSEMYQSCSAQQAPRLIKKFAISKKRMPAANAATFPFQDTLENLQPRLAKKA